uniref:Uncharacterized protein n=1 Tax=Zosterops lateralis melanops TaxID=1220523 RepID=A0A8D2QMN2_ZOSLA
ISGSKSSRGAALFNKPTSSSNSVANTEEGNLMVGALEKETEKHHHNVFVLSFMFELTLMKSCRHSYDQKKLSERCLNVTTSAMLSIIMI